MPSVHEIDGGGGSIISEPSLIRSLEGLLEGIAVYKSADVPVLESTIVNPNDSADVKIYLNTSLFPYLKTFTPRILDEMKVCVRSRWAQAGLDIGGQSGTEQLGRTDGNEFEYSKALEAYVGTVKVKNYAQRPLRIHEGSRLFRYYFLNPNNRLNTAQLISRNLSGEIQIDCENWSIHSVPDQATGKEHAYLYVPVSSETFQAVDPDDPEPFTISDSSPSFGRKSVDQHLIKPKPQHRQQLLIGETPKIYLAKHLNGELHARTEVPISEHEAYQLNSRLLDGGITNHPVRVEIFTDITGKINDNGIFIDIYEDNGTNRR